MSRCGSLLIICFLFGIRCFAGVTLPQYLIPDFYYSLSDGEIAKQLFPESYIIDANNDNKKWNYTAGKFVYSYSEVNDADDWLVSHFMQLEPGHTYQINIGVECFNAGYPEVIEAYMAGSNITDVNYFNTLVIDRTTVNWTTERVLSGTFTVDNDDCIYYSLGIHACSAKDQTELHVTSFGVTDLGITERKEAKLSVEELAFVGDPIAGYDARVSATIANTGESASQPCYVEFSFGEGRTEVVTCPAINPGTSVSITSEYKPSLFEKDYDITAKIIGGQADTDDLQATLIGTLQRSAHPAPRITRVYQQMINYVIVEWEMPNEAQTQGVADNANAPGELIGYNIYRNRQVVGQTDALTTTYHDNNTDWNQQAEYHVNAVYQNGISDISQPYTTQVNTSVTDIHTAVDFKPSPGALEINTRHPHILTDLTGRIISRSSSPTHVTISLPSGPYILTINTHPYKLIIK